LAEPFGALCIAAGVGVLFLFWKFATRRNPNFKTWVTKHPVQWGLAIGLLVGIPAYSIMGIGEVFEFQRRTTCGSQDAFWPFGKSDAYVEAVQLCGDNYYLCTISSILNGWTEDQRQQCFYLQR